MSIGLTNLHLYHIKCAKKKKELLKRIFRIRSYTIVVMQWVKKQRQQKSWKTVPFVSLCLFRPTFDQCISVVMEQQIGVCIDK